VAGVPEPRFSSPLREEVTPGNRSAAILGIALGVGFAICFVTGVLSHLIQDPPSWFSWPARPAGLYRFTQGLHVVTGIALIPLVLAKLWLVYPMFFQRPVVRSMAHLVERISLLPLVGGAIFLLFTGLANVNYWRPWKFGFRDGHYAAAWITIGGLVIHVVAKWSVTWSSLRSVTPDAGAEAEVPTLSDARVTDRRAFLGSAFGASGLLALFVVGMTATPLRKLALLAPRRPDTGPQGFAVNRTAASVNLTDVDLSSWRLTVDGPATPDPLVLTYDDLMQMDQHEAELPIACVEGWSTSQRWRGVRIRDLIERAGAAGATEATVISMQRSNRQKTSTVDHSQLNDPDTLLALAVNDETLVADHGFPARLIGPNRPGVLQTKWVERIEVR
jgi:DMSO/TMAO reductase YedYZ molybdopterin-dependent catalytic subunit